jgi:hypothetical protein
MSTNVCAKLEMELKNLHRRKEVKTFSDISVTILEKRGFCKNKFVVTDQIYVVQYVQHSRHELENPGYPKHDFKFALTCASYRRNYPLRRCFFEIKALTKHAAYKL